MGGGRRRCSIGDASSEMRDGYTFPGRAATTADGPTVKRPRPFVAEVLLHSSLWNAVLSYQDGAEGDVYRDGDRAARLGHLGLIKMQACCCGGKGIGCEEPLTFTPAAMDGAAASGHLEVVKFLHETREEGGTSQALQDAVINGHSHVVRWLLDNSNDNDLWRALDAAAGCPDPATATTATATKSGTLHDGLPILGRQSSACSCGSTSSHRSPVSSLPVEGSNAVPLGLAAAGSGGGGGVFLRGNDIGAGNATEERNNSMAWDSRGSAIPEGIREGRSHDSTSGFDAFGGAGGEMQAAVGAGGGWNEEALFMQPAYQPPNNPTAYLFGGDLSRHVRGDSAATKVCRPLYCKPWAFADGGGGFFLRRADSSLGVLGMLREAMPEGLLLPELSIRDRVTRAASAGRVDILEWLRRCKGSGYERGIGGGDNDDCVDDDATTLLEYASSAVEAAAAGGHIQVLEWFRIYGTSASDPLPRRKSWKARRRQSAPIGIRLSGHGRARSTPPSSALSLRPGGRSSPSDVSTSSAAAREGRANDTGGGIVGGGSGGDSAMVAAVGESAPNSNSNGNGNGNGKSNGNVRGASNGESQRDIADRVEDSRLTDSKALRSHTSWPSSEAMAAAVATAAGACSASSATSIAPNSRTWERGKFIAGKLKISRSGLSRSVDSKVGKEGRGGVSDKNNSDGSGTGISTTADSGESIARAARLRANKANKLKVTGAVEDAAAAAGHVHVLEWLNEHARLTAVAAASASGTFSSHRTSPLSTGAPPGAGVGPAGAAAAAGRCTAAAFEKACEGGHLDVAVWLACWRATQVETAEGCFQKAAGNGHLHVVKWLHVARTWGTAGAQWAQTTEAAMDDAAAGGHLRVVKWLHRHRREGCTMAAMDRAAANGHLQTVTWLHEHRSEGCSIRAMDLAAAGGHLDVVKFLHHNRTEGCTPLAMDKAAENNHLETLQWLRSNRAEGWTVRAANAAARNGHLCALAFLLLGKKHDSIDGYMDGGKFGGRNGNNSTAAKTESSQAAGGGVNGRGQGETEDGNGQQDVDGLQLAAGATNSSRTAVVTLNFDEVAARGRLEVLKWAMRATIAMSTSRPTSWSVASTASTAAASTTPRCTRCHPLNHTRDRWHPLPVGFSACDHGLGASSVGGGGARGDDVGPTSEGRCCFHRAGFRSVGRHSVCRDRSHGARTTERERCSVGAANASHRGSEHIMSGGECAHETGGGKSAETLIEELASANGAQSAPFHGGGLKRAARDDRSAMGGEQSSSDASAQSTSAPFPPVSGDESASLAQAHCINRCGSGTVDDGSSGHETGRKLNSSSVAFPCVTYQRLAVMGACSPITIPQCVRTDENGWWRVMSWSECFGSGSLAWCGNARERPERAGGSKAKRIFRVAFSKDAVDRAAMNGHFEVVRWLYQNRAEGGTIKAVEGAAANGHVAIVDWLYRNTPLRANLESTILKPSALDIAAGNGHLGVVRWFHRNTGSGADGNSNCLDTRNGFSYRAMDEAASNGHLQVCRWLRRHRAEGCSWNAFDGAAAGGHTHVLEWLADNFGVVGPSSMAFVKASKAGHLHVLQWLLRRYPKGTDSASHWALQELSENCPFHPSGTARGWAVDPEVLTLVKRLSSKRNGRKSGAQSACAIS